MNPVTRYFLLSIVLISGIFTSCNKGPVDVRYVFSVITENTVPDEVKDPGMHETYVSLLRDLNNDLASLMNSSASTFLGAGDSFHKVEGIELNPRDFRTEDERRITVYDNYLLRLKQIESSYKDRIEAIGKRAVATFRIDVHFLLTRGSGDSDSVLLKEYHFELTYNS